MDIAFGVICVLLFLLLAFGPVLRRIFAPMLQRWMLGKMEDNMRRMAGMPTRKEERKARKESGRRWRRRSAGGAERFGEAARGARSRRSGATESVGTMMRYVAEDVEFTEIKEFSDNSSAIGDDSNRVAETKSHTVESQVEDAEFEEIRMKDTPR